jgi:K+-sensing histidine kinase KdpD
VALEAQEKHVLLRVENDGPPLADAIRDSLFDSMVSLRNERVTTTPHLGLGLYIARLIAEFHAGSLQARNLAGQRGVAFQARLSRAV